MFIQCSDCDYKYIVNSADLKPDGRMVECANCNHRWYQEPLQSEELLSSSVPHVPKEDQDSREKKVSLLNTFLVIFLLVFLFFLFWVFKSYGSNIFVLVSFYINEFFFNLRLIIDDLAKIIYQILN